jgi:uncharacterized repeat protein (TIGR03806 family)
LGQRPYNTTCLATARPSIGSYSFDPAYNNLFLTTDRRTGFKQIPGADDVWFLADRAGRIIRFAAETDINSSTDVLDISDRISLSGERGLLGFAFSPNFASDGAIYVSYTTASHTRISRFISSDGGQTFPSSVANEQVILEHIQATNFHNGGDLHFGPSGYLYLSLGDDGTASNAQDISDIRGSLIRIDPNSDDNLAIDASFTVREYAIPPDNPLIGTPGARPEIYAYGFRNPWRFSIDSETGDVWLGDVGEADVEEIDLIVSGGNFGWPHKEGTDCFETMPCDSTDWIDPVIEYRHDEGISVIAGYVYRGANFPELAGRLIFSEWSTGVTWALSFDPLTGLSSRVEIGNVGAFGVVSWGQANDGEIFAVKDGFPKLSASAGGGAQTFPQKLSETGCVVVADPTQKASGLIPYDINTPLWSDNAEKQRWFALPDDRYISINANGHWDLPIGSVLVKDFIADNILVETRLLMRHDDGNWAGYPYKWNADGTDADLVLAGSSYDTGSRVWAIPSAAQCLQCHTDAAGQTLGPETAQLNRRFMYPGVGEINQLTAAVQLNILDIDPGDPALLPALSPIDANTSVEKRARDYLHVQCAHCHQPGSVADRFDLRWQTSFADTGLCNIVPISGDLGVAGAALVKPGFSAESIVSLRMHVRGDNQMPKIGSDIVDANANAIVDSWINALVGCP